MSEMRKRFLSVAVVLLVSYGCASAQNAIHDTIRVEHHTLTMDLRDIDGHTIYGDAELKVVSRMNRVRYIPLRLLQMQIDSVSVDGKKVRKEVQYDGDLLRIPLKRKLRDGAGATVRVVYHGEPVSRNFGGFVWDADKHMAHNMGVSLNDIPHSFGKSWYPCVDDFRAKSTFDFHYITQSGLVAVGNGLLEGSVTRPDGAVEWDWSLDQPVPDYLVNVAVGPYECISTTYSGVSGEVPIQIYVTKDEYDEAVECYSIMPAVLESLESHFGAYPFSRVGFVSVNTTGGAMEHATNISMPRRPRPSQSYREIAIHELIHSWFGDFVTCSTAGDMWLNEGITSYVVEVVLEDLVARNVAEQSFLDSYRTSVDKAVASMPKDHPRYHPLAGMPETDTYGMLVYKKGAWVMRQLREYLGDELFFNAMKVYVREFGWGNAGTEDFKRSIERSTGKDLSAFFEEYIYS